MTEITAWQLFLLGGPMMWPIFFSSVFVLAVVIEKSVLFSSLEKDTHLLKENVFAEIRNNNIKGAMAACDRSPSFSARLFKAGLIKFGASKDEISQAMDEVVVFEVPQLEKMLPALAMIAQAVPLLGLLGTALGLAVTFHVVQVHAQVLNPVSVGDIAAGVWQSLIATIAGLIVGITALMAYNYICARLDLAVCAMEKNAADLVNFMTRISDVADPGERE